MTPPAGRIDAQAGKRTHRAYYRQNDKDLDGKDKLREIIVDAGRIVIGTVYLNLWIFFNKKI